jgi:nitrogen fixation/metabolism regulation signal transduction histidine kinase
MTQELRTQRDELVSASDLIDSRRRFIEAVLSSASAGIGYATGAGGTVTQATSKTTGVTLNTITGAITMNAASLGSSVEATFTVTNSTVTATDAIIVNHASGGTAGAYLVGVASVGAGSFQIVVGNVTAGSLAEAIVLRFVVIKAVSA